MRDSVLKHWMRSGLVLVAGVAVAVGCGTKESTGPAADYTLSLAPAALTIVQGANGTATVTITRTNFTGAVTLSLGGAPTGVTGSFNPAAPTGTSATLTVSVGGAVAAGVYNLTVAGAGSAGNRSTPLTLTVNAASDYTLSVAPTALTIAQGANGTTTVTITRTSFTGAVTLSLGNAPTGVTGSFNPAAPTGTSSTLTVSVGAAVAPGVYNLTVDGTATAGNRSTPLTLTVSAAPDYSLSLAPAALTVAQAANGTATVTITRTNFTSAVTLSLGGAPAGVTGAFNPAAPTGTTSALTVSVGAAVAPGVYNLTVNGTGAPGNRSTPLTLTVSAAPDYTLSLSPTALTIGQGATGNTTVTITRTNFTGAVTLSLGSAPAGVTGSFSPAAPTGTSSTLTVSVAAAVAPGLYNLTVDGTGTPGNRSTPLTLTVSAAPDYTLSLSPTALTIGQGATGNTTVTITRTNFTGAVTLSLGNAPAGVTGSFNPAAPTGTSSTLTVSVGAAVAPGVYNLTVDGTATAGSATPDYALSLSPAALTITQGATGTSTVTITRTNFTGAVTLSLGSAPTGVTGAFNPAAPTGTSSTLTVSVDAAAAAGVYNLTVDGTATTGNHSTPLTLTVSAAPDYAMSLAPAALTIVQGATGSSTVTITRTNFTGAVTLSLGGAPTGVTGAFNPAAPTGTSSALTVSVGAAVAPGVYNLTVDGTATAGNRSTPLTLTVSAPAPDYTLSVSPTALTIAQGASGNTTVTISRTNFTAAVTLSLGNAPTGVTGAFNPTAPTGTSSTLTVSVGAAVAAGVYNLTVDGTGTPGNRSTPLTLTVSAPAPDYSLSLTPAALTIVKGENGNATVTITRTNFTGAVTLSLAGAPTGVTGAFTPAAPTGTSATLTVSVSYLATPGVYSLTVNGTASVGNRSTPLALTVSASGISDIATVDAGASHSCALRASGQAYCWGYNGNGRLGDGTTTRRLVPTPVAGGLTFASLSAGAVHTCGVETSGAAYCWGYNGDGELGDGTTTQQLVPNAVAGGLTFASVNAGAGQSLNTAYSCGVTSSGAAYCWGTNFYGQLGDGTTTQRLVPTSVAGGLTFATLSVGSYHTCGVTTSGAAYCWGYNLDGELGDNTTTSRPVPTAVAGGLTFASVTAGDFHTCAVTTSGAAYCWGAGGYIGDGTTTRRLVPTAVAGGLTYASVDAARTGFTDAYSCGVTTSGAAYCWGYNGNGQLGDGTTTQRLVPDAVAGGLTFAGVGAGGVHTCGVTTSGAAYCWGSNGNGELGDGTTTQRLVPMPVAFPTPP